MSRLFVCLALSVLLVTHSTDASEKSLPRSSPESQGVSSKAIREFVETANEKIDTLHSFMLVRHGRVIAEGWWKPEAADKPHVMHSLSKSFCSTAVGLAVADGKLSVDDLVLKFFPDDAPEKTSDRLKQMRIRDLLTMSTGHETEPRGLSSKRGRLTSCGFAAPVGEDANWGHP